MHSGKGHSGGNFRKGHGYSINDHLTFDVNATTTITIIFLRMPSPFLLSLYIAHKHTHTHSLLELCICQRLVFFMQTALVWEDYFLAFIYEQYYCMCCARSPSMNRHVWHEQLSYIAFSLPILSFDWHSKYYQNICIASKCALHTLKPFSAHKNCWNYFVQLNWAIYILSELSLSALFTIGIGCGFFSRCNVEISNLLLNRLSCFGPVIAHLGYAGLTFNCKFRVIQQNIATHAGI